MAEIHNIEQKKHADRRTALLALAATSEDAEKTSCLTADEMATLVDSQCEADDLEQFYNHLAHCEICFRQWVELSELTATDTIEKPGKAIHTLFQPRNLAWAGSALAAAASVVLFLNITGKSPAPVMHKPIQTGVERSLAPVPGVLNDDEQVDSGDMTTGRNIDGMHDTVQLEMEIQASKPSSASVKIEEKTVSEGMVSKKQKFKAVAPKEEAQVMDASGGKTKNGLSRRNIYQGPVDVSEWIERIQQGCLSQEKNIQYWEKLYQEGINMIRYESSEEKILVKDLLSLIEQLQQSSDENIFICKRILKQIETNPGW